MASKDRDKIRPGVNGEEIIPIVLLRSSDKTGLAQLIERISNGADLFVAKLFPLKDTPLAIGEAHIETPRVGGERFKKLNEMEMPLFKGVRHALLNEPKHFMEMVEVVARIENLLG